MNIYYGGIFTLFTSIVVLIHGEVMSSMTWSDHKQNPSVGTDGSMLDGRIIEGNLPDEGFILVSDRPKYSPSTKTNLSTSSNAIVTLTTYSITSTTCQTTTKILPRTSPSILDPSLDREVWNKPSYREISSVATTSEEYDEIDSFLKVDEEEMSRQLVDMTLTTDGSGETSEPTTEGTTASLQPTTSQSTTTGTTTTTTAPPKIDTLSNVTQIIIELNCTNANATINAILGEFYQEYHDKLRYNYSVTYNTNTTECAENFSEMDKRLKVRVLEYNFGRTNYYLNFITNNNITALNNLFAVMENVTKDKDVKVYSVDKCGSNTGTVLITNVTSCTLINLCGLCGINPIRGVCYPDTGLSICKCFRNTINPSRPYDGERCFERAADPITSTPSRWTPIIIGILASLAIVFCVFTSYFLVITWSNHRQRKNVRNEPRVQILASPTLENIENHALSTSPDEERHSTNIENMTIDDTFFRELDQKMSEKPRAKLVKSPLDTMSTSSSYDPIDELNALFDNEDINLIFADDDDDEMLEIFNPNMKSPISKTKL